MVSRRQVPHHGAMDTATRLARAYARQRALGNESQQLDHVHVIRDVDHPDVWAANHASLVRAASDGDIAEVFDKCEAYFAHCDHRMFVVDEATPAAFVTRLFMAEYEEQTPIMQMLLRGEMTRRGAEVDIRKVDDDGDFEALAELVRADYDEGQASRAAPLPPSVVDGLLAGHRAKWPRHQFFIASLDGKDCAYGAGADCGDGMGMVEDLFTLPDYRGRGVATSIVERAVRHVRDLGAQEVMIGTHVTEAPKVLYASLGFVPTAIVREFVFQS